MEEIYRSKREVAKKRRDRLLKANLALQKALYREYIRCKAMIDMVKALRNRLKRNNVKKKKENKQKEESIGIENTQEKNQMLKEKKEIQKQIFMHIGERKCNITPLSAEWEKISKCTGYSKPQCMSAWFSPDNPFYIQNEFTPEEDKKILQQKGCWATLCTYIKRAPIAIYMRYKELQYQKPISKWTAEEDHTLFNLVQKEGLGSWIKIAANFKNKTARQCMYRYLRSLSPEIVKGKWTKEEDEALVNAVKIYGKGSWNKIKKHVPGRNGFQCRERYLYCLEHGIYSRKIYSRKKSPNTSTAEEKKKMECKEAVSIVSKGK